MTSPGLIITPRVTDGQIAVESETCEIRTRRFKKLPDSGVDQCKNVPEVVVPMLISEQNLQRLSTKRRGACYDAGVVEKGGDEGVVVGKGKGKEESIGDDGKEALNGDEGEDDVGSISVIDKAQAEGVVATGVVSDDAGTHTTTEVDIHVPRDKAGGIASDENHVEDSARGDDKAETTKDMEEESSASKVGLLRKIFETNGLDDGTIADDDCDDGNSDWLSQYGCYLCQFVAWSVGGITQHWLREHMAQKPYLCSYCHAVFSTSYKARWHVQKFHGGREIVIGLRPSEVYRTPLIFEMERPDLLETTTVDEPRKESGAGFYVDDEEEHQGQFFCRKCNFGCGSTYAMKLHIREQHLQYRPFSCTHCQATFTCSYDMKRHLSAKHADVKSAGSPVGEETGKGAGNVYVVNPYRMGEGWEICTTGGTSTSMLCRRCNYATTTRRLIYEHVMEKHPRPDTMTCVCCKGIVPTKFNAAGRSVAVRCRRCGAKLRLCTKGAAFPAVVPYGHGAGYLVHICKICDYKTREKSGMTRHIKYNHTQCRPYLCPYCSYAAVERPKVRIHIASNHRGRPMRVNKSERAVQEFRDNIAALFKKLTFTVNDKYEVDLYEGSSFDLICIAMIMLYSDTFLICLNVNDCNFSE